MHMLVQERADGVLRAKPQFFFTERYAQSYREEWPQFVRVLDGEAAPDPRVSTASARSGWPKPPMSRYKPGRGRTMRGHS